MSSLFIWPISRLPGSCQIELTEARLRTIVPMCNASSSFELNDCRRPGPGNRGSSARVNLDGVNGRNHDRRTDAEGLQEVRLKHDIGTCFPVTESLYATLRPRQNRLRLRV